MIYSCSNTNTNNILDIVVKLSDHTHFILKNNSQIYQKRRIELNGTSSSWKDSLCLLKSLNDIDSREKFRTILINSIKKYAFSNVEKTSDRILTITNFPSFIADIGFVLEAISNSTRSIVFVAKFENEKYFSIKMSQYRIHEGEYLNINCSPNVIGIPVQKCTGAM